MNKVELIAAVTEKTGMSKKDAEKAVSCCSGVCRRGRFVW